MVVSDPGDDPWVDGRFGTRSEAEAHIDATLDQIAAEGLDADEWRGCFRVEQSPR
jgi:hypothetical protein